MSFSRVKPAGWGVNEILSSSQANSLDTNVSNAFDIRTANTNSVASTTTLTTTGRIIKSSVVGANANTNYQADGGNLLICVNASVTANRTYSLISTNAQIGDEIVVFCQPTFVTFQVTIKDQATNVLFTLGNQSSSDGTYAVFTWTSVAAGGSPGWTLETNPGSRLYAQTFTTPGANTFNVPPGVALVSVLACGGGGGGGGGSSGTNTAGPGTFGGSGGGGARLCTASVAVTPSGTATATVGAGGTAGAGGASGGNGVASTFAGSTTVTFAGAQGGFGTGSTNSAQTYSMPSSFDVGSATAQLGFTTTAFPIPPQYGGYSMNSIAGLTNGFSGGNSPQGFAGGNGGSVGANSGAGGYIGGGGGSGGGAGPFGAGAQGGGGGTGFNPGTGGGGVPGTAGAANTGAGGGGGGGGGAGTVAGGAGAIGGAGGSGQITVYWVK